MAKKMSVWKIIGGGLAGVGAVAVLPVAGPIGAVTLAGGAIAAGIGAAAGAIASGLGDKEKPGDGEAQSRFDKSEVLFALNLASYASHIDGTVDESEKEQIMKDLEPCVINGYTTREEIENLLAVPPNFKDLKEMYGAISYKRIPVYNGLLEEIVNADRKLTEEESIFKFKCRLLFDDDADVSIFKVVPGESDRPEGIINELVKYITAPEAKREYGLAAYDPNAVYVLHPADDKQLIPASMLFDVDLILDRETEILEAMRIAGAKKVTISQKKKSENSSLFGAAGSAEIKVKESLPFTAGAKLQLSGLDDLKENECIEIIYEGKKGGLFSGFEKKKFLKNSRWLSNDPKIKWLFESRFKANRPESFFHKIEYSKVANLMGSVSVMAELNLLGSGKAGKVGKELKRKSEMLVDAERLFVAEFA